MSKEYNTIKLEKQDIKTYETLKIERDKKNKKLYEIEEENNSKEFKQLIDDLIKNENKYREEQIKIANDSFEDADIEDILESTKRTITAD